MSFGFLLLIRHEVHFAPNGASFLNAVGCFKHLAPLERKPAPINPSVRPGLSRLIGSPEYLGDETVEHTCASPAFAAVRPFRKLHLLHL